jgi:hypothetical protein
MPTLRLRSPNKVKLLTRRPITDADYDRAAELLDSLTVRELAVLARRAGPYARDARLILDRRNALRAFKAHRAAAITHLIVSCGGY